MGFTSGNVILIRTMKLKRRVVLDKFKDSIAAPYA
jgi:hypothetical protein